MELKLRRYNDIYILDISGELDLYNTVKLTELSNRIIEKGITNLIINMEAVSYLDSSGVGSLLSIYNMFQKKELGFALCSVQGTPLKVMELTKLTNYFPIKQNCKEAIKFLSPEHSTAGES